MSDSKTDPRRMPKDAHPSIASANAAVLNALPFEDRQDYIDAQRGFIDTLPDATITTADGRVVWTLKPYAFLANDTAPPTVNPSLWRQSQLNMYHGLFEVSPGVYQVRGFDIANMTLIEGATGVIVVDTLTSIEGARAAIAIYRKHRGDRPVSAVIYTHTHADHWGGARGVLDDDAIARGVPIIAPNLFMEYAVSENVIAGNAMIRRAQYQFGPFLPRGERAQVDNGLGKSMAAGSLVLVPPNDLIMETGDERVIDDVRFVFQMAPESEAPAEMHFYLPELKLLNMAENATHNFHNLLPFRGSEVRNAQAWSGYINEALKMWGDDAEALVGQHHWPVWGNANVRTRLKQQRDIYKFAHDQTVRLLNHGLTASEIAEVIETPKSLDGAWHARGYYGHIRHNVKAIYQRTLGWYDANPAHLDPLPPVTRGRRIIDYMGGADNVLARARKDFEAGDFRVVAEVLNHLVFAEPDNEDARLLLADTYEQLGYLTESSTWRNSYLFGAQELRHGMPKVPNRAAISHDTLRALTTSQIFDYLGIRLNGPAAEGKLLTLNWQFTDTGERCSLTLENCALTHLANHQAAQADVTLTLARSDFIDLVLEKATLQEARHAGKVSVEGDGAAFETLMGLLDTFARMFAIVEPGEDYR